MKIKNIWIIIVLLFIGGGSLYNCSNTQSIRTEKTSKKSLLIYAKGNVYKEEWKKIDSLEQNGLTKSALQEVKKIYQKAKKEDNYQQVLKSLIVKAKFQSLVEENAFTTTIQEITLEATKSDYPLDPLLHSIIAEMYWQYYKMNRWKFQNRTTTVNFNHSDISTWDLKKIIHTTKQQYLLSLQNIDSLKRTPVEVFDELIIEKNARKYRPFLYDFLAHRALDFFINEESNVTNPADRFVLDNVKYMAPPKEFATTEIANKNYTSLKYDALKILQQLTQNHLNDTNPEALIDVELKRLKLVKAHAIFPNSDSLYYAHLNNLYEHYKHHSSVSDIVYKIASVHYANGNKYQPLQSEDHKWEFKKAKELCLSVVNKDTTSFGGTKCKHLINLIEQKRLTVLVEKINQPNVPLKAKISARNIDKVYYELYQVNFDDYQKWKNNRNLEGIFTKVKSSKLINKWGLDLQSDGDFQQHSSEFKIDALPLGFYVLLTATTPELVFEKGGIAMNSLWVSNLSYLHRKKAASTNEIFVFNRETGFPIQGVKAELFYKKYNYSSRKYNTKSLGTKTTNKDGIFTVLPSPGHQNYYINLSYEDDQLNTQDAHYSPNNYEEKNAKQIKTFFFTDRAIYRPGQTVYFKGIVIEVDHEMNNNIQANFKSTVTFYDVNHQKISDLTMVTNEYGTFSGSFIAPNSGLNGRMYISDTYGSKYFSVEEYKRPKFEVKFKPIKGNYKLEENVQVLGMATTYSGAVLDGATVKYRVVRNGSFPRSCYYRYGYWPQSAQIELKNGSIKTNDDGQFKIDFIAQPDLSIKKELAPTYSYTIYADVTDINGETHSNTTTIRVAYKALNINIEIPEVILKNGADSFGLTTTNLNGEHEPTEGSIEIWALKQPSKYYRSSLLGKTDRKLMGKADFEKSFPLDAYGDENNKFKWEKSNQVGKYHFNTAIQKTIQLNNLSKWSSGIYVLEATTKDKYGQDVKETSYFTVADENDKQVPINEIGWFAKIKNKGEPGEEAIFLIGSAAENVNVLYEIEHKNKIVKQERIILKNASQRKISIPIEEKHRGNFQVHFTFVKHQRKFTYSSPILVPYTNKELNLEFKTFRNKLLPGQKEEWKISIKGKQGEKVAAEMVATLYDASLDAFRENDWNMDILRYNRSTIHWQRNTSFSTASSRLLTNNWSTQYAYVSPQKQYDYLNWFGYTVYRNYGRLNKSSTKMALSNTLASAPDIESDLDLSEELILEEELDGKHHQEKENHKKEQDIESTQVRKNFNETAFFYPHLTANEKGEIEIKFTIPEALTRWKFMGLAHTKDLKTGTLFDETVTQKKLMVFPNAPRFFRENDVMSFSTKINNLSEKELHGEAKIFFYDALTMQPINIVSSKAKQPFHIQKGKSTSVNWEVLIPEGYSVITYKVVAKTAQFSDGEEMAVPVLTNRMLVTEAIPLPIRGNQTKEFKFDKLINNSSSTLKHHQLTLEYTSNPAWYAIQALPYLMESPYECSEQVFSRFYANAIASHIVNAHPKIKSIFESWKNNSPDAFLSHLEKNEELKSLVLAETPWVINAQDERERKKRIALLFDLNRMGNEFEQAKNKLQKSQTSNGGWTWFKGMPVNRYITQHIVTGMGRLDHLGIKKIKDEQKIKAMLQKAVHYLDRSIREDYERQKKYANGLEENHINAHQIQYLYARSYFTDLPIGKQNREAYDYYKNQAEQYWVTKNKYLQGMIALVLGRDKTSKTANHTEQKIMASLKENAIEHEELGMYWKDNSGGYYWHQAPIETQALLIEAFDELTEDKESVEAMKVWLLKQKQTQDWKTTKATAEACYALLLRGTDLLSNNQLVEIKVGKQLIDPKKIDGVHLEAGTGYFKTSWNKTEIKPAMGNITVSKKDDGVAWGAIYWQYFENLDKITPYATPLKLVKKLFLETNTPAGPVIAPIDSSTKLKVGDKIKVRIELRVDRDMEYVHMKDMRASGLEPETVFSGYRFQDGLGYYESTKDASTNFFFDVIRKGTYVFEYSLRVNIKGDYSCGITSIQCMYAPEYISHSEGIRINITN